MQTNQNKYILLYLVICIVICFNACSSIQIDLRESTDSNNQTSIFETSPWNIAFIEKIDGTKLEFSNSGYQIFMDPGTYQILISCWNRGAKRVPFLMNVDIQKNHHYIAKCKFDSDIMDEHLWVEVIDKNIGEVVNRSPVTFIAIETIDSC